MVKQFAELVALELSTDGLSDVRRKALWADPGVDLGEQVVRHRDGAGACPRWLALGRDWDAASLPGAPFLGNGVLAWPVVFGHLHSLRAKKRMTNEGGCV